MEHAVNFRTQNFLIAQNSFYWNQADKCEDADVLERYHYTIIINDDIL